MLHLTVYVRLPSTHNYEKKGFKVRIAYTSDTVQDGCVYDYKLIALKLQKRNEQN